MSQQDVAGAILHDHGELRRPRPDTPPMRRRRKRPPKPVESACSAYGSGLSVKRPIPHISPATGGSNHSSVFMTCECSHERKKAAVACEKCAEAYIDWQKTFAIAIKPSVSKQ